MRSEERKVTYVFFISAIYLFVYLLAVGVETAIVAGKQGEKVAEWLELPNGCVSFFHPSSLLYPSHLPLPLSSLLAISLFIYLSTFCDVL